MSAASPRASGLLRDGHVPGTVQFGDAPVDDAAADLPQLLLNKPAIGDETEGAEPAMLEVCSGRSQTTALAVATASAGPGCCRRNDELMFGAISVPVAAPGAVHGDDALGQACSAAYRAMLDCLQAARFSCLLRIWNSTPDINVDSSGLERYRRFKLQRFRAVWEARLPTHIGAPAAPALGTFSSSPALHFLAARQSAIAVENPRQVSAYNYPSQYGPRAPNSSRAALWCGATAGEDIVFVSSTASIVGHETQHRGDGVAQTRETLTNLGAVLAQARKLAADSGAPMGELSIDELSVKTYVHHRADLPAVRATLAAEGVAVDRVLIVNADICRAGLPVEIEAMGPAAHVAAAQ